MGLPERLYYSLDKAAKEINGDVSDLLHYISIGFLDVSLKVNLSDYIELGKVSINGKFDKNVLIKSCKAKFRYRTNYARITEFITTTKDNSRISRQVLKAEGVFSIRFPASMVAESKISECESFNVSRLYPVRLPTFTCFEFYDYMPRAILINGGLDISFKDLVITKDELHLLKLGGIPINWRLNNKHISIDKMPAEFSDRLHKYYSAKEQGSAVLVGKPRNKYRDAIIDIAKATRVQAPWSSTASMIRKIHSLLESNDPKSTPRDGTIRNILCSEGIGKTGNETKQDFDLVIPEKYSYNFKLNG